MSDLPLNVGFFSVKSSPEEKSSTMKVFRLRVKKRHFKMHTNYSEIDRHVEQPKKNYLSSLSDVFFGFAFGVFTRCRTK